MSLTHAPVVLQDVDHIESHTFATSTSTQFCILFKRTFICILRDTVRAGEAGPALGVGLFWGAGRDKALQGLSPAPLGCFWGAAPPC